MTADPLAIARDLVRCRSVTPDEGGALGFLQGLLAQAGFTVHRAVFDEPGTARYLKLTVQLELVDAKAEEIIEKSKQVIRDEVLRHLSGLKLADTLGAKAKDTLRDEIMKMIEDIVGKGKVRRMFFQEFVVQ